MHLDIDFSKYVVETGTNGEIKLTPKVAHEVIQYSASSIFRNTMAIHTPGRWLILGCIHFPWHKKDFWEAILKYIDANKGILAGIILNGDIIDCFSVSRHNMGMWEIPGLTLQDEYNMTNIELDRLDAVRGNVPVIVTEGNHDTRILRWKKAVDNAKLGDAVKDYTEGLNFKERDYIAIRPYSKARVAIGNYLVFHGFFAGQNAAKKHVSRFGCNVIFNHTHRVGQYMGPDMTMGINGGWMGDKEAEVFNYASYAATQDWQNAFTFLDLYQSGYSIPKVIPWEYKQTGEGFFLVEDTEYFA